MSVINKLIISLLKAPIYIAETIKKMISDTLTDKKLWNTLIDIYVAIFIGCLLLKNNQLILIDYFTNYISYYYVIGCIIMVLLFIKTVINQWGVNDK